MQVGKIKYKTKVFTRTGLIMSESRVTTILLALMLTLLISFTLGQVTECTSSPKLRFVAQLSISGCPIFVHDTGASDGPHLVVEPLMCVTQSPHKVLPQYDPVIQQTYVSVPVVLRNDAILTEVEQQLRHLSPKSVKFATLSAISVSRDNSSKILALGFDWKPDEPSGVVRIGCESNIGSHLCAFTLETHGLSALGELLNRLMTLAVIEANGKLISLSYHLTMQNRSLVDLNISSQRYSNFAACHQLRFIRSIGINNCTARVHQRLDMEGHFLIEPLLCHNITSFINESVMYDYSRDMYYLKLDIDLQDDITLDAVRSQLADLSPLNVTFMRLWRAETVVASALSRRFEIGGLVVSGDWRSGQMRVYCRAMINCENLSSALIKNRSDFWRHIIWTVTSVLSERILCSLSVSTKYSYEIQAAQSLSIPVTSNGLSRIICPNSPFSCKFIVSRGGRDFEVIQQRLTGSVSFQREWSEYETGFGDGTDFWIGLSTIHSLSINGTTLRLEMKLWNGTELHAEFAGFKVGDASTNYTLTVGDLMRNRSSPGLTATGISWHNGKQFSTFDRRNAHTLCFTSHLIKNGWWIYSCASFNPNGNYGGGTEQADMIWYENYRDLPLREVRMMLRIG